MIKNDKYRLDIEAFDNEFEKIKSGRSKYNYRLSVKEKLSEGPLESYEASISPDQNKIGFNLKVGLNFGMYLYVIEKIDVTKRCIEELAFGFIEILPEVVATSL